MRILFIMLTFVLMAVLAGCTIGEEQENNLENRAVITDRTGRKWDVTHARDAYGMNPDYYNYGLGVGAISSVDNPVIIQEGSPDYPSSDSTIRVFGVDHNGEQRAYSISALSRHEVFNDIFPGERDRYLAVTF